LNPTSVKTNSTSFVDQWSVEADGVKFDMDINATEESHAQLCDETQTNVMKRREERTKTDTMCDDAMRELRENSHESVE